MAAEDGARNVAKAGPALRGRPRWYGWIPAVVGLPVLFTVGMLPVRESIEDDLTDSARTVLDAADLAEVHVEFEGRDATISGMMDPDDPDITRAHDLVRNGTGVRHVTDDFEAPALPLNNSNDADADGVVEPPTLDPDTLALTQSDGQVVLSGTAFDESTAEVIRQATRDALPDATIEDDLTVKEAGGTPLGQAGAEAFASMAAAAFANGTGVTDLGVSFLDGEYVLTGTADDSASASAAFEATRTVADQLGTSVIDRISIDGKSSDTEAVSGGGAAMPDGWSVNIDTASTPAILEGAVPSAEASDAIESAMSSAVGAAVDNRINVDPALPPADADTIAGVADALAAPLEIVSADGGTVIVSSVVGEVTLQGRVSTASARDAAQEAAGVLAGADGSVLNELNVADAASADDVAQANAELDDVLHNVEFEVGSASLTEEGTATVDAAAKVLTENPAVNIRVEGHTDNTGSAETNQELSDARAQTVVDLLIEQGVAASRLTARGFGDSRPIDSNDTDAGRAANRRIEFVVS